MNVRLTKNQLKYYSSLLTKKQRHEEKKFLVEGPKLILEALESGYRCATVFALNEIENDDFMNRIQKHKMEIEFIKPQEFEKLCDTKNPQGVVGVFNFKHHSTRDYTNQKFVVALENISDPGNMGTILRNCDWFGVKNILLNRNCAEIYNPKVIRASAGSLFHLNISMEEDLINLLSERKKLGYKILCADLKGENLYNFNYREKLILVLANEANGPTEELLSVSDLRITIPRKGNAESLNVACASAVILSELSK